MPALAIRAVGAKVGYASGTVAGSIPTAFTTLPDVHEAFGIEVTQDMTDASCITEEGRTYVAGHTDHTQNGTLSLCHTDAAVTGYNTAKAACDAARAAGKEFWLEYWFPGAAKGFFFTANLGMLGTDGLSEEAVFVPAPVGVETVKGWDTKKDPS